jgi:hypothetical protein
VKYYTGIKECKDYGTVKATVFSEALVDELTDGKMFVCGLTYKEMLDVNCGFVCEHLLFGHCGAPPDEGCGGEYRGYIRSGGVLVFPRPGEFVVFLSDGSREVFGEKEFKKNFVPGKAKKYPGRNIVGNSLRY